MAKSNGGNSGAPSGSARSAITGRYVSAATAARHPKTTVVESRKKR